MSSSTILSPSVSSVSITKTANTPEPPDGRKSVSPTKMLSGETSTSVKNFVGLYDFKKEIGRGHFGVVHLAEHALTKEQVAVKVIDKTKLDPETRKNLYNEVRIMKLLKHPNIVALYEVAETPNKLYLILQYASGGDLLTKLNQQNKLDEDDARFCFREILSAVLFCHELKIVHRDIKPENILFTGKGGVKVSDFGMSEIYDPDAPLDTYCGTYMYSAPEILLGDKYEGKSVDIWSLGVTLFMCVCGRHPFDMGNPSESITLIMDGNYSLEDDLSDDLKELISSMLVTDASKRATLNDVKNSKWLSCLEKIPDHVTMNEVSKEDYAKLSNQLAAMNIDIQKVEADIKQDRHTHRVATYRLLQCKLQRQNEADKKEKEKSAMKKSLLKTVADSEMMQVHSTDDLIKSENGTPTLRRNTRKKQNRRRANSAYESPKPHHTIDMKSPATMSFYESNDDNSTKVGYYGTPDKDTNNLTFPIPRRVASVKYARSQRTTLRSVSSVSSLIEEEEE